MAYDTRTQRMSALVLIDPSAAKKEIVAAFRQGQASRQRTAEILQCSIRTLARWIDDLEMEPELDKLRAESIKKGWHHGNVGGRPKKQTV